MAALTEHKKIFLLVYNETFLFTDHIQIYASDKLAFFSVNSDGWTEMISIRQLSVTFHPLGVN